MHNRATATLSRTKAADLNISWGVGAAQARYSYDGHWYATLSRFPAALFDPNGYLYFANEQAYQAAPISIGKQISVPKPGISGLPGYVRVANPTALIVPDAGEVSAPDADEMSAAEGRELLGLHRTRVAGDWWPARSGRCYSSPAGWLVRRVGSTSRRSTGR